MNVVLSFIALIWVRFIPDSHSTATIGPRFESATECRQFLADVIQSVNISDPSIASVWGRCDPVPKPQCNVRVEVLCRSRSSECSENRYIYVGQGRGYADEGCREP